MLSEATPPPADEARLRLELGIDAARLDAQAVAPAGAVERGLPERRGHGGGPGVGAAGRALQQQAVDVLPHQPGVGADHAVGARAVDPVGIDEGGFRPGADVALRPQDVEHRVVAAAGRGGGVVDGHQIGHARGLRHAPGEPGRRERRHDPAGVDQVVGRGELLDAVEEERAFVGEEERLARVELELPGIGFDLREVGIHGAVEREGVGDAPAHVHAQVGP